MLTPIPRGLMARIPGFHPGGPGSIPGVGVIFFSFLLKSELFYDFSSFFLECPNECEYFFVGYCNFSEMTREIRYDGFYNNHLLRSFSAFLRVRQGGPAITYSLF